jgi:hypothetical protein
VGQMERKREREEEEEETMWKRGRGREKYKNVIEGGTRKELYIGIKIVYWEIQIKTENK